MDGREDWEGDDPNFFMEELQPRLDLLPGLEHYASPINNEYEMLVTYPNEQEVA